MSTTIQAKVRETEKHSQVTDLRQQGDVPAVVYGFKTDAQAIAVNEGELLKTLRDEGRNGVFKLQLEGESVNVVLHDYQEDPLKDTIVHADFLAINMKEELEVTVQIHLVGESKGEKSGGVIQQPNWEVQIKVQPTDIPETFDLDISEMEIGDTLTVEDIRSKSAYEILEEDDFVLVTISAPRSEAELAELDEATQDGDAEPAVIGEKDEA